MKITKQRLKEIIKEELNEATEEEIRADIDRPRWRPPTRRGDPRAQRPYGYA